MPWQNQYTMSVGQCTREGGRCAFVALVAERERVLRACRVDLAAARYTEHLSLDEARNV